MKDWHLIHLICFITLFNVVECPWNLVPHIHTYKLPYIGDIACLLFIEYYTIYFKLNIFRCRISRENTCVKREYKCLTVVLTFIFKFKTNAVFPMQIMTNSEFLVAKKIEKKKKRKKLYIKHFTAWSFLIEITTNPGVN